MLNTMGGIESIAQARSAFCAVNPHCLERIVGLAQETQLIACCDIVDEGGSTLLACGASFSGEHQQRLLRHRLRTPLEASLDLAQGASLASIVSDCLVLIDANPALALLGGASGAQRALRAVGRIPLPAPLTLLLTLARRFHRGNYENSLAAMIISSGLANGVGLCENDSDLLIISALVQDIGELYIDPQLIDGSGPLPLEQWRNVAAHPLIGQAFLTAFTQFPPALADCVLQHHERQDGSGYPFQQRAAAMTPLGTLIGLADCVSALVMGYATAGELARGFDSASSDESYSSLSERVAVALGIVPGEFPPGAVAFVSTALAEHRGRSAGIPGGSFAQRILPTLQQIRSARLSADALSLSVTTSGLARTVEFAQSAIRLLDKRLRTTGVYDFSQLGILESDPERMGKTCLVLDEVKWRMRHLARSVYLQTEQSARIAESAKVAAQFDELLAALCAT
jgi:hypothetical protein